MISFRNDFKIYFLLSCWQNQLFLVFSPVTTSTYFWSFCDWQSSLRPNETKIKQKGPGVQVQIGPRNVIVGTNLLFREVQPKYSPTYEYTCSQIWEYRRGHRSGSESWLVQMTEHSLNIVGRTHGLCLIEQRGLGCYGHWNSAGSFPGGREETCVLL